MPEEIQEETHKIPDLKTQEIPVIRKVQDIQIVRQVPSFGGKFKKPYIARETEIAHMFKKIKESMNRDNQKCMYVY